MKEDNIIQKKSYAFALKIVKLYQFLKEIKEYDFASQVLRAGTSIGSNVEEAIGGASEKDFLNKLTISYKETREIRYWLRLLRDSDIIKNDLANNYIADSEELLRILGSIQKTMKSKIGR